MRTPELGVVSVMMVVRALPDAAGAENQNPKDSHQALGQAGVGQDRLMLLIVIDHKQPENEQPGENAANDLAGPMKIPKRPRQGNRQEKRGGQKIPPAPPRVIRGVRLGCQYEFFTCSHTLQFSRFSLLLSIITSPRLGHTAHPKAEMRPGSGSRSS